MISVAEALPFCHHNICFNILCFFPDWNHLNCICRGLYRLINIVTPLRALVFCDSTARVKESTQPTPGPSLSKGAPPFLPGSGWAELTASPEGRAGLCCPAQRVSGILPAGGDTSVSDISTFTPRPLVPCIFLLRVMRMCL